MTNEVKSARFDELAVKSEVSTLSVDEQAEYKQLEKDLNEQSSSSSAKNSNPAKVSYVEGTLIKVIDNVPSRFNDDINVMLIVKTKTGLERFYVRKSFYDKMDKSFDIHDKIMLSIEHRIVHQTTYTNPKGETVVFGADAPKELWGAESRNVSSIDSIDTVAANIKKETKAKTDVLLTYSDDELERLSKIGLRF